jgi:multisubunit Na+/H+ antiporter MnhF subunit
MFYIISGIFLLTLLPFSGFAPHLVLIGVFSLITGIIVLVKKEVTIWFVAVQCITVMTFAFWNIYALGTGSLQVTAVLVVYAVLDIVATAHILRFCLKKRI